MKTIHEVGIERSMISNPLRQGVVSMLTKLAPDKTQQEQVAHFVAKASQKVLGLIDRLDEKTNEDDAVKLLRAELGMPFFRAHCSLRLARCCPALRDWYPEASHSVGCGAKDLLAELSAKSLRSLQKADAASAALKASFDGFCKAIDKADNWGLVALLEQHGVKVGATPNVTNPFFVHPMKMKSPKEFVTASQEAISSQRCVTNL